MDPAFAGTTGETLGAGFASVRPERFFMHAHKGEASPTSWTRQVEEACARQGLQLTPLRQAVLAILSENRAPLGAYAIIEALSRREGKAIAPPTVYRTLDFLLEHGFLHKIESRNSYARCEHFDHAHQGVLLLCEKCGRSDEVEDLALVRALRDTADRAGFQAHRQMVELVGVCRECSAAAA
jgi:Fur family zinc uptake transcriptional regulator